MLLGEGRAHHWGTAAGVRGVQTRGVWVQHGTYVRTYVPSISLSPLTPLRAVQMSDSNVKLREELDQAHSTTQRLNEEVLRLSGELSAARQRLNAKEREWEEKLKVHTYMHTCIRTYVSTYVHHTYICVCLHMFFGHSVVEAVECTKLHIL